MTIKIINMKTTIYFVLLIFSPALGDIAGECDLVGFYTELGCTAMPNADNTTMCPEAFSCPNLHPDFSMCYYRGVPYAERAMIPQSLVSNPCFQACSCRVSGGLQFDCAAVDCVQTFNSDVKQECLNTYELDSCCSTDAVCGKDAIANLKTCEVDGQIYKEGQLFEPANTRKSCVCTAQWNGSYDDPSVCSDINCGLEIYYQDKILNKCAPVFATNRKGCPIAFQCPSETSKVIRGLNLRSISTQCSFGNMNLNVGDEVTVDEKCTTCSCDKPPFVSCMRNISCDFNKLLNRFH